MQEVIVYRNPFEAWLWHTLFGGGGWVFLAVIALGFLWAFVYAKWERVVTLMAARNRMTIYTFRQSWWVLSPGWAASIVTAAAAFGLHMWNIS